MSVRISGDFGSFFARERCFDLRSDAVVSGTGWRLACSSLHCYFFFTTNLGLRSETLLFLLFSGGAGAEIGTRAQWNDFKQGFERTKHSCLIFSDFGQVRLPDGVSFSIAFTSRRTSYLSSMSESVDIRCSYTFLCVCCFLGDNGVMVLSPC